jgi:hypothetical protein
MYQTPEDLERLTGYKRPSAQIRWLQTNGFTFTVNGLGDPVVATAEVERKLVGGGTTKKKSKEPNWDAMDPSKAA